MLLVGKFCSKGGLNDEEETGLEFAQPNPDFAAKVITTA
jgi:hypothetical protein